MPLGRAPLARWAGHPAAGALLAGFAVAEATVFPAPTEALLVALVLADRRRAARMALVATLGSVAGAALGYAMGTFLLAEVAGPVLGRYGGADALASLQAAYSDNLALALVTSGYTPIPFLLYTAAAGAAGVPLAPFLLFALVGRGLKYGVIGALAFLLGPAVEPLLRRLPWAVFSLVVLGVLLWWVFRS